jgi:endo-alpha-1,4-polygalactosaminidase (GH114 family)
LKTLKTFGKVNRAAKTETKKRKLKSALDRIRNALQAKSARIVIPQNNDEELLMELFN